MNREDSGQALRALSTAVFVVSAGSAACAGDEPQLSQEPVSRVAYVRTPDARFENLPDYTFRPHYVEVAGGLRLHYVDEGPRDGGVVVLLHGEPSWSFLYRKMIPILAEAGFRVIAPDLIGFGRSDKPLAREDHTYERHVEWIRALLFDHLELTNVVMFAHDWGGLIGLRVLAENPDRFRTVALGNTGLPTGDEPVSAAFLRWREASQRMPQFQAGAILQSATVSTLPDEVVAAYDAPFPDSTYQAGARVMPVLVPIAPDDPASAANRAAWTLLENWSKPLVLFFSDSDPVTRPWANRFLTQVPGAEGQPHRTIAEAGHFLQEDKGEELAHLLVEFLLSED